MARPFDRRLVKFEIAGVHNDAGGSVQDKPHAIGHRMGDPEELNFDGPQGNDVPRGDNPKVCLAVKALVQLAARKPQRKPGPVHGDVDLGKDPRQRSHVVLVAVSEHYPPEPILALDQVGYVGDDQVDPGHVLLGERQAAVYRNRIRAALDQHKVLAYLAEPAQGYQSDLVCHLFTSPII